MPLFIEFWRVPRCIWCIYGVPTTKAWRVIIQTSRFWPILTVWQPKNIFNYRIIISRRSVSVCQSVSRCVSQFWHAISPASLNRFTSNSGWWSGGWGTHGSGATGRWAVRFGRDGRKCAFWYVTTLRRHISGVSEPIYWRLGHVVTLFFLLIYWTPASGF